MTVSVSRHTESQSVTQKQIEAKGDDILMEIWAVIYKG